MAPYLFLHADSRLQVRLGAPGMLTAVASPLINSALFGMPAADTLPPILFKSSLLAVAAGLTAARCRRVSLPLLAAVVLGYQAIALSANGR